jgi:hypothetical protein
MKQYNLKGQKRQLSFGELNVIVLGEKGRGRYENLIPFQNDIAENDFVISVPTKSGKNKIIKGGDNRDWIARISCEGTYTRGTEGYAFVHKNDAENVSVIAFGNGAEGDAGRIGWWADYLLLIKDNTLLRVKPHGGHKTPPYYLYFGNHQVFRFQNKEELALWSDATNNDYIFDLENFEYTNYFTNINK